MPDKGGIERANRTLQDRLVKELRLAGISDMVAAMPFCRAPWRVTTNALPAILPGLMICTGR